MPMPDAISNDDVEAAWRTLVEQTRTGVLLTLRNGHPFGSHVPYLLGDDWARVYLHLSRLALHTLHLLEDALILNRRQDAPVFRIFPQNLFISIQFFPEEFRDAVYIPDHRIMARSQRGIPAKPVKLPPDNA